MKIIGIGMQEKDDMRFLKGYLAELQEGVAVGDDSTIKLNNEIVRTFFTLDKVNNRYSVAGSTRQKAIIVGEELQKIGYTGLTLVYNGEDISIK